MFNNVNDSDVDTDDDDSGSRQWLLYTDRLTQFSCITPLNDP